MLASCGALDKELYRMTHGRVSIVDGVKKCVDWNSGTSAGNSITIECSNHKIHCCQQDELAFKDVHNSYGKIIKQAACTKGNVYIFFFLPLTSYNF